MTTSEHNGATAQSLCATSPDCVKVLNRDGLVQHFNEDGLRLMEIDSIDRVRGVYWPDLWPAESRALLEESLRSARDTGVATFTAPCPTARNTPKWWHVTVAAMPGTAGDIVVVSRDITETQSETAARDQAHGRLEAIIRSNLDVLWDIDLTTGQVWWGEGLSTALGYPADQTETSRHWYISRLHPDDRHRIMDDICAAIDDGAPTWEADFRFEKADGDYIEVYNRGTIIRESDGTATRFIGVMQDVTARNEVSTAYKALAGEMAHRVNNILAVVSGLFQQTLNRSDSLDHLATSFGNRLKAMATANTAILRTAGQGASLTTLAEAQLGPFIGTGRLRVDGDPIMLPERLAQPVALALNELATNALKYGALSNDSGTVDLRWTLADSAAPPKVSITWAERGGPPVTAPTKAGLGSRLIERGITGAKVERDFAPEGFTCVLSIPLGF